MIAPYYQDESTTLYHADALDILEELAPGSVDIVATDPPYIIGAASAGNLRSKTGGWADMMNSATWFTEWYRLVGQALADHGSFWSFCNWRTLPVVVKSAMAADMPVTSLLVWDKEWIGPGGPKGLRPSYELCALMAKPEFRIPDRSLPDIWRHKTGSHKPNGHPAEKPVGLLARILDVSAVPPDGLVLDPFVGSGTTAVAAKSAGLRCVAVEAEERYCEIAARRLQETHIAHGEAA